MSSRAIFRSQDLRTQTLVRSKRPRTHHSLSAVGRDAERTGPPWAREVASRTLHSPVHCDLRYGNQFQLQRARHQQHASLIIFNNMKKMLSPKHYKAPNWGRTRRNQEEAIHFPREHRTRFMKNLGTSWDWEPWLNSTTEHHYLMKCPNTDSRDGTLTVLYTERSLRWAC